MDLIRGCLDHVQGDGIGQLCELFDGSDPNAPGGALAAAAAVGELLRCYAEDIFADESTSERAATAPAPTLELTVTPPQVPHPA
jgi:glycogen debranching enzyme